MTLTKRLSFLFLISCFPFMNTTIIAQENNCFGIVAGCKATTDGSVLLGHNEDDGGEQMLNIYIAAKNPQKGTHKFIWAEFPGMEVADAFMNEYGVAVASDNCPSREDKEDYTDGGILFNIRMDVAKYATSARDAVRLIGMNVEKYGYRDSGRSYIVADTHEGWVVSIVRGRHWIAQRVPDDKVMTIPNYYVIDKIDLNDTDNFMGSADIVTYAESRGWYNPATDGEFSFRKAYGAPKTLTSASNTGRHAGALAHFAGKDFRYDVETVPFVVTPARKITTQDVMDALCTHRVGGDRTKVQPLVCNNRTVLSTVCQLRDWMPRELGCVMWICPGKPCTELYIPWYMGMTESPKEWTRFADWTEAEAKHMSDAENKQARYPQGAYWKYVKRWENDGNKHHALSDKHYQKRQKAQRKLFEQQVSFEKSLIDKPSTEISKTLNTYTASLIKKYQPGK
jgi:dipeptidase